MKINPKYLIYHDLIGLDAYAKPKSHPRAEFSYLGSVIDDTENMLITENYNDRKKYIKKKYIFRILIPNQSQDMKKRWLEFDGEKIVGRPENRLRSLKKKRRLKK
ncbi:MAG: Ribonuclease P protein component 1 [Promethearchaeota archaeon]|nr:MAG: Ribonuclease P protein component 1 [Candidatus Lokiarchaeota archaeon]